MKSEKLDVRYLVLWVVDRCNLDCKYCYARPNFTHTSMSLETAIRGIETCKDKNFTLIFAGGEPLLNFHLIEKVYEYLEKNGYSCKLGIQTNGTLITKEVADKLSKMKIDVGISLDGDIKTNETLRGGSIKALEGINLLGLRKKDVNINCVVSNKNIGTLEKLVELAYYLGNVQGIGLDLVRITGNSLANKEVEPPCDEDIYINLKRADEKRKLLLQLTGKDIKIREIEEIRLRKSRECRKDGYCYSSLGQALVITPSGDTYPCSSLVGDKRYHMGNIYGEIKMKSLPLGRYERCKNCEYERACKGCCPSRLLINSDFNAEDKDCVLRRAVFRILDEEKRGEVR